MGLGSEAKRMNAGLPSNSTFGTKSVRAEDTFVKRIKDDNVFIINDIALNIPPTNIIVSKEDVYWNWKTLRSKSSTKVPSGQGFCQVSVNIIFTPDLVLHLHRLIVEIKHNPFVSVENRFLRDTLFPYDPFKSGELIQQMAFAVSNFHVNQAPGLPGTMVVRMDMKYFNYKPYTPNYLYKKDYLTLPIKQGSKYIQKTIPVISGPNCTLSQVPIEIIDFEKNYSGFQYLKYSDFGSLLSASEKKSGSLENSLNKFSGVLMDGMPLPSHIMPSTATFAYHSNIYKRYINQLQFESLYFNFNIDVYEEYNPQTSNTEPEVSKSDWIKFTIGLSQTNKHKTESSLQYREVQSFHLQDDAIVNRIIDKMHSHHSGFNFTFNEFISVEAPPFVERIKKKIMTSQFVDRIDISSENSSGFPNRFQMDTDRFVNIGRVNGNVSGNYVYNNDKNKEIKAKDINGEDIYSSVTGHNLFLKSLKDYQSQSYELHPPIAAIEKNKNDYRPYINSGYGIRKKHPVTGALNVSHEGIDLKLPKDPFSSGGGGVEVSLLKDLVKSRRTKRIVTTNILNKLLQIKEDIEKLDASRFAGKQRIVYNNIKLVPVFAIESGVIHNNKSSNSGHGNQIVIESTDSTGKSEVFRHSYSHLFYESTFWTRGKIVNKGDILGFIGASGGVTGPHLHLEIWVESNGQWKCIPPYPLFERTYVEKEEEVDPESFEKEEADLKEFVELKAKYKSLTDEENVLFNAYVTRIGQLIAAGYQPYTKGNSPGRVFYKNRGIPLNNLSASIDSIENDLKENIDLSDFINALQEDPSLVKLDEIRQKVGQLKVKQETFVTSCSGSFSNIIASIPIVGHEFPTTQHMGSMEPTYMFEIQSFDQNLPDNNLESISLPMKYLNSVLNRLQEQGRRFREAPDSHAFCLDTFITRLLGSFRFDDIKLPIVSEGESLRLETKNAILTPRCISSRSQIMNVEGYPGRFLMNLEVSETNPFHVEGIQVVKSEKETVDTGMEYWEILLKLKKVKQSLSSEDKTALLYSFLSSFKGSWDGETANVKKFNPETNQLEDYSVSETLLSDITTYGDLGDEGYFLFGEDSSSKDRSMLNDYIKVQYGVDPIKDLDVDFENMFYNQYSPYSGVITRGSDTIYYVSEETMNEFYNDNPWYKREKGLTGEDTIQELLYLVKILKTIESKIRHTLAEGEVGGVTYSSSNDETYTVEKELWNVDNWANEFFTHINTRQLNTARPSFWKNYIYFVYHYLASKVLDDGQSDSLNAALGWTVEDLDLYMKTTNFKYLYGDYDENAVAYDSLMEEAKGLLEVKTAFYDVEGKYTYDSSVPAISDYEIAGLLESDREATPSLLVELARSVYESLDDQELRVMSIQEEGVYVYDGIVKRLNMGITKSNKSWWLDGNILEYYVKEGELFSYVDLENVLDIKDEVGEYVEETSSIKRADLDVFFKDVASEDLIAYIFSYYESLYATLNLFSSVSEENFPIKAFSPLLIEESAVLYGDSIFGPSKKEQFTAETLINACKRLDEKNLKEVVRLINEFYSQKKKSKFYLIATLSEIERELSIIIDSAPRGIEYKTPGPPSDWKIHPDDKRDMDEFISRQLPLGILDQNAGSFGAATLAIADTFDWFLDPGGDDTEFLNGVTGQTEAQLQIKAEAFVRARNTIWSRYLDYLNEKRIDNGFGVNVLDDNFSLIKAYVNMRFSKDEIEKNRYTQEYRMFSSVQDYCSQFLEWFLEPRLVNNVGLDAILFGASDKMAYINKFFGGMFKTTSDASIGADPTSSGYIPVSIGEQKLLYFMGLVTGAQATAGGYGLGSTAIANGGLFSKAGLSAAVKGLGITGTGLGGMTTLGGVGTTLLNGAKTSFSAGGLAVGALVDNGGEVLAYGISDLAQSGDPSDTLPSSGGGENLTIYENNSLNKIRATMRIINQYNSATSGYYQSISSEYQDGVIAEGLPNSTGARFENLDENIYGSMFMWDDIRTLSTVLKTIDLSVYVNQDDERAKVQAFRNELEALVKEVLRNREVCAALDIPFFDSIHKYVASSEKYSGSSAYPDLDLPIHPFYNRDNFEVGPAFYMWDMYVDGGCGISKEYLDGIEANAKIYLEGAYSHIKKMEKGVISSVDFLSNTDEQNDAADSNTLTTVNEGTDNNMVPVSTYTVDGSIFVQYQNIGEARSPFFTGELQRSDLLDKYKEQLITQLNETQSETVTSYTFKILNDSDKEISSFVAETREQVVAQRLAIYNYLRFIDADGNKTAKKGFLNKLEDGAVAAGSVTADALVTGGGYLLGADTSYLYDGTQGVASVGDAYSGFEEIPLYIRGVNSFKPVVKVNNYDTNLYYSAENQTLIKDYEKIQGEVENIERMFGNGAGYVGDLIQETTENSEAINGLLNDVKLRGLGSQVDYNQTFSLDGLNALAKASSARLFAEKKKVSQAFPTFKLFFVEEDEFESRFINMDDFYSFNGVRSFTVNRSRESAADTAIVSLQNVAGTLDGTRRGATVDVDYFSKKKVERIKRQNKDREGYISTEADNFNLDSEKDQPFSAVVMRPGMNVQLRAGYSNNPDNLEVLISGRVTDISWGGAGDICEIVIQSFGTELVQQLKGFEEDNDQRVYYATHQVLGDLMLSPELKHFGRWETGKIFQYGEAQDSRLDFFKYKANGTTPWYQSIFDWQNFLGEYAVPLALASAVSVVSGLIIRRMGVSGAYTALAKSAQRGAEAYSKGADIIQPGFLTKGLKGIVSVLGKTFQSIFNARYLGPLAYLGRFKYGSLLGGGKFNTLFGPSALRNALKAGTEGLDDLSHLLVGVSDDLILFSRSLLKELDEIADVLKSFGNGKLANGSKFVGGKVIEELGFLKEVLNKAPKAAQVKMHKDILTRIDDLINVLDDVGDASAILSSQNAAALGRILNMTDELAIALVSPNYPTRAIFLQGFKQAGASNLLGGAIAYGADLGFAYIPIFLKTALIYTIADNYIMGGMLSTYKEYREAYKNWFTKELVYFKLNPADDNLYPPSPVYYMHNVNATKDSIWKQLGAITSYVFSEFSGTSGKTTYEFLKAWKESNPIIYLKRVLPITCEYILENVTIWDVFHEMSLRHPGWIYSAVPYGKEFRYTMFFGIPSQRYWSKPASPAYIRRMNSVREVLTSDIEDLEDVDRLEQRVYGEKTDTSELDKLYNDYKSNVNIVARNQFFGSYNQLTKSVTKAKESVKNSARLTIGKELHVSQEKYGNPYSIGYLFNKDSVGLGDSINWEDCDNSVKFFEINLDGFPSASTNQGKLIDLRDKVKTYLLENKDKVNTYLEIFHLLNEALAEYSREYLVIESLINQEDDFVDVKGELKKVYTRYYGDTSYSESALQNELEEIFNSAIDGKVMTEEQYVNNVRITSFRSRLMKEYLTGLQNRFVPFRNYHLIRSKENLVRNNFTLSSKNAVNSVNVYYSEVDDNNAVVATKSIFLKASSNIPDENLQTQNVDSYEGNIRSRPMATRYGISSLIYGMKEMYGGELTILGDPSMKPWDVCFLFDDQNKMKGPFEIKAVTHIFSFETGFLTEITPNAIVVGNETSSWPIIEALKVYVAGALARENLNPNDREGYQDVEGSLLVPDREGEFSEESLIEALTANAQNVSKELGEERYGTFTQKLTNYREPGTSASFNGYNLSFEASETMINRYSDLVQDGIIQYKQAYKNGEPVGYEATVDTSAIFDQLNTASNEMYGDYYDFGRLAEGYAEDLYELGVSGILLGNALRPLSGTTGEAGVKVGTIASTLLLGSLAQGIKGKVIAGSLGLLSYGVAAGNQFFDNRDKILDRFTSSYLIAAPIIFSKLMENEAVTIVPMVKEGKPLLAGVSTRSPTSVWKNILGDILSNVDDSFKGMFDTINENEAMGSEFYRHLLTRNAERANDPGLKYLKESGQMINLIKGN